MRLKYKESQRDHTIFIKHYDLRRVTILLDYIDGIIMTRNDEHEQQKLGRCLSMEFEIKTLVKLKYLL